MALCRANGAEVNCVFQEWVSMIGEAAILISISIALLTFFFNRRKHFEQKATELRVRSDEDSHRHQELIFNRHVESQRYLEKIKSDKKIQNALILLDYSNYDFGDGMVVTEKAFCERHLNKDHDNHDITDVFVRDQVDALLITIGEIAFATRSGVFDLNHFQPFLGYYARLINNHIDGSEKFERIETFINYSKWAGFPYVIDYFRDLAGALSGKGATSQTNPALQVTSVSRKTSST